MSTPNPGAVWSRDGEDFNCGDEIQIIFRDTANLLDFHVDLIVQPGVFGLGL